MESEATQARAFKQTQPSSGTYKLTAKPSLISEGEFQGELRSVAFIATSPIETMQWFVINCGQFERAFSKLIPRGLATEMVDALTRGEAVEFPGLYQREQFGSGFYYEWFPVFSDLPRSLVYADQTESEVLA
jgi:hypothetical protein